MAGTQLNSEIVHAFRWVVPVFPRGTNVMLRGGDYDRHIGVVAEVHPEHLGRPTVVLFRDSEGKKIEHTVVDTRLYPDVTIQASR
jgi:hypothetical protein